MNSTKVVEANPAAKKCSLKVFVFFTRFAIFEIRFGFVVIHTHYF